LKEGGKMCTKYVGVRERESVFVISQSLKDCFSKLKIVINYFLNNKLNIFKIIN
jgi:hypothetical protein